MKRRSFFRRAAGAVAALLGIGAVAKATTIKEAFAKGGLVAPCFTAGGDHINCRCSLSFVKETTYDFTPRWGPVMLPPSKLADREEGKS